MKSWLRYFQHNCSHRQFVPWHGEIKVESHLRQPLIRSLQKFQVGESGEGTHLRKQAATTQDSNYQSAIDLFIKEEQEHARLMAAILKKLGAPLHRRHWSDGCFVLLRRLFALNHELLVLLMPEMIAKRYFRALRDACSDPILHAAFGQILHDEEGHLAFHVDFLQRSFSTHSLPRRLILRLLWRVLFRLVCLVVIFDHRGILKAVGVSAAAFWWDCGLIFDEVAAGIFSCAPTQALTKMTSFTMSQAFSISTGE